MSDSGHQVRRIVQAVLGVELPDDDTDLISTGLLDSLSLVSLVVELEEQLGLELPFADLDLADFRSVPNLVRLVGAARVVA